MWYLSLVLITAVIATSHYDYGDDRTSLIVHRGSNIILEGVHNSDGSLGTRPEVRDLEKDSTTWALYLLALDWMQSVDQSDSSSWYALMGIHGRPFIPYDNVQATPGNSQSGYCSHISILFPTWHRPFIALYEQFLYDLVGRIAAMYPAKVRARYVAAAKKFRVPYWDWAMVPRQGKSIFPQSVQVETVYVNGPGGTQEIDNPLFSYLFNPLVPSDFPDPPFNTFLQTMRYPITEDNVTSSRNNVAASELDSNAGAIRSRLYNLMTHENDYSRFSNEEWIPNPKPDGFESIESIHDTIHGLVGMGGHMNVVTYASFDPIFMLHHTMVDRVFAMWQSINPNSYVTPTTAKTNTFTTSFGQIQDRNTPLTPFRTNKNSFWTSDDSRSTTAFGYAYPETLNTTGKAANQVITAINILYGSANSNGNQRRDDSDNSEHYEWLANIRVNKYATNASFFIHAFLGPFNSDPSSWTSEKSLIGSHGFFLKPTNNSSNNDLMVSATIPLTNAFLNEIETGALKSLQPEDVTDHCKRSFAYRLTTMADQEIDKKGVPSLVVSLVGAKVQLPKSTSELPVWEEMISYGDLA